MSLPHIGWVLDPYYSTLRVRFHPIESENSVKNYPENWIEPAIKKFQSESDIFQSEIDPNLTIFERK